MRKKLAEALKTPFRDRRTRRDILVGGMLSTLPLIGVYAALHFGFTLALALVPSGLFPVGYLMRRLELIARLQKPVVRWEDKPLELFLGGAKTAAVVAGYLLPPFLLMLLAWFIILRFSHGSMTPLALVQGAVLQVIMSALLLVSVFFLPAALWATAEEGTRIGNAFETDELFRRILLVPGEYLLFYLAALCLFSVSVILLIALGVAAVAAGGFLLFYDSLVAIHLLGKIFPRKTVEVPLPSDREPSLPWQ